MRITRDDLEGKEAANAEPAHIPTDEEREKNLKERLAAMTPRERFLYYLDYYKIPVIIIAFAAVIIGAVVHDVVTHKDYGFYAEFVNSLVFDKGTMESDFAELARIDLSKEDCYINFGMVLTDSETEQANVYAVEQLTVHIAAGDLDVFAADEDVFRRYAKEGTLMDLRNILDAETLERFSADLVEECVEEEDGVFSDPVPLGIRLDHAPRLEALNAYPQGGGIVGIVINTKQPDRAKAFINYLFEKPE